MRISTVWKTMAAGLALLVVAAGIARAQGVADEKCKWVES